MNVRAVAAQIVFQVVDQGQSLATALPKAMPKIAPKDQPLVQEICYGILRDLPRLEGIVSQLMDKPMTGKQRVFHHLILVGLYQLSAMRIPPHAAVGETVNATKALKKPQLRGLINAVLRNYQRQQADLDQKALGSDAAKFGHPSWLLKRLQTAYPDDWQSIIEANHQKAPMWLRVNAKHHSAAQYQSLLAEIGIEADLSPLGANALCLHKPCDVKKLPGFEQGWVSVQDLAAQLAVDYLNPQPNERILDCCAAPGGKTCHILEREPSTHVVAMDIDELRLSRVQENLTRLNLSAELICGDARTPETWWQGDQFDRILLDAPCSALGVIRRHPDIKWLRRDSDIEQLTTLQAEILDAMWAQLRTGGTLIYATCSITPEENAHQIRAFLDRTPNASLQQDKESFGHQILPGQSQMDGFFYAVLHKA